jgi:hypothetical protein
MQRHEDVGCCEQAVHLGAAHRPFDQMNALISADRRLQRLEHAGVGTGVEGLDHEDQVELVRLIASLVTGHGDGAEAGRLLQALKIGASRIGKRAVFGAEKLPDLRQGEGREVSHGKAGI